jgi:flagellar hook protein FlgE
MALTSLSAGLSGLYANQQALGVEAHNTANTATRDFAPQSATFAEAGPAGSGVTLSVAARELAASEDPDGTLAGAATSMTNSLVYRRGFELSARVIQAADERLGTLIDTRA